MHLRFHLIVWSLLLWSSTWTLRDEDWDKIIPDMTTVCPNVDFCGKTKQPSGNVTTESNSCCRGCSCASNCRKSRDCCDGTGNVDEQTECLKPSTSQELIIRAYEFVAKPPVGGCKMSKDQSKEGNVTCSSDEVAAPWGNFLPVFSRSLNRNFKNEACARCHGAQDIEEWKSALFIDSVDDFVESLVSLYENNNFTKGYVVFSPPKPESTTSEKRCYKEMNYCHYNYSDIFHIPTKLQLDKMSIMNACERGPVAKYIGKRGQAFKNIFCAICSGFAGESIDNLRCENDLDDGRNLNPPYRVILDANYMATIKANSSPKRTGESDCYRPKGSEYDSICKTLYCPISQVRLKNGQCGYTVKFMRIENLLLCLNVSFEKAPSQLNITQMSAAQINSLFKEKSPWSENWIVFMIGSITDDGSNKSEFLICLLYMVKHINLESVNEEISSSLSKKWIIGSGIDGGFDQKILKHGPTVLEGTSFMTPRWTRSITPITANLTVPIWKRVYAVRMRSMLGLNYNKMFMCEQIELQPDEYQLAKPGSVMYLLTQDRYIYPYEYLVLDSDDDSQRVRVCLEDSGYVKVVSSGLGTMQDLLFKVIIVIQIYNFVNIFPKIQLN